MKHWICVQRIETCLRWYNDRKVAVGIGWTNVSAQKIGLRADRTPDGIICLALFFSLGFKKKWKVYYSETEEQQNNLGKVLLGQPKATTFIYFTRCEINHGAYYLKKSLSSSWL